MISIVITYYDPLLKRINVLTDLLKRIGEFSCNNPCEIQLVSNSHSYVEAVNEGLRRSKGEYIVVLNDDIILNDRDWLAKLCVPGCISSWRQGPDAACFAMSREVFDHLGPMDERYKDGINYEDVDYFLTARNLGIPFYDAHVDLIHLGAQTFESCFNDKPSLVRHNEELFNAKWRP